MTYGLIERHSANCRPQFMLLLSKAFSERELCLDIHPIGVVRATEMLEGLSDIVASKEVGVAGLELQELCRRVRRDEINLLPSKAAVLRMDAVAARSARRLAHLVEEVACSGEPKDIVGEGERKPLYRGDARFEVRINDVLPGEEIHRAIEFVVRGEEVNEGVMV